MDEMELEVRLIFCEEALEILQRWESISLELSKEVKLELWQEIFRLAHNLKGGSRSVGLKEFGDFVHSVEDGITLLRDGKAQATVKAISLLLKAQKILFEWIESVRSGEEKIPSTQEFIAEYFSTLTGDANHQASPTDVSAVEEEPLEVDPVNKETKPSNPPEIKKKTIAQESIRVPAKKIDELTACIGELSIHQSILWHLNSDLRIKNKIFLNSLQIGQKLTKELYDRSLRLRMQPVQSLFQRLERNILDLSQTLNKEVNVITEGSDVELDKMVLEKMVDPLTHIVRNAIDHGIEPAEQREEKGKGKIGLIKIMAKQESSGVVITVLDDGKGLVKDKILQKAIEKGLVSPQSELSESQIFSLILAPGFSTAEKITDVSGRGVGMDVVSKSIEELKGKISIESKEGQGSSFHIALPTSVSIIDGLIIKMQHQLYVVPVESVEEVMHVADCELDQSKTMISLRSEVIPIQSLRSILKLNHGQDAVTSKGNDSGVLLIAKHMSDKVALSVDAVIGQQQIVVRVLNDNIGGLEGIMGGTILGNGEPGLIIDVPAILQSYLKNYQHSRKNQELSA